MSFGPPSTPTLLVPAPTPGARIDGPNLQTVLIDALDTAYSRGRVIVSDRRDDTATTGPAAPYRIVTDATAVGMALVWMLAYTVPEPLPGSANSKVSSGATAALRGALRLVARGKNVRVRLTVYQLTLPHTLGASTSATVTMGSTTAWGAADALLPPTVQSGDMCAIHVVASADPATTGLVSAFAVIEPPQTDLTP